MNRAICLVTATLLAALTGEASAQEVGQPRRGLAFAQEVCAECHAIRKGQGPSPNAAAPSFDAIAATRGMTAIALSAALQTSHRTMPNLVLKADERADVIAYILSLKDGTGQ